MLEIQKDKAFQRNDLLANGLSDDARRMVSGESRHFRHAFINGVRCSKKTSPECDQQSARAMRSTSIPSNCRLD